MKNEKPNKYWVLNKTGSSSAELTLYGEISDKEWWGDEVTPQQLSSDLKALGDNVSKINVRLNSPGGNVFAGLAIRSLLKSHKAHITVYVDGWAASIASIIAMAGDKIVMAKGSMMMIHNPMTTVRGGNSKQFREVADWLDQIRDSMVTVYKDRTGQAANRIIEMMDAETWMSAEEAVDKGFADQVEEGNTVAASMMGAIALINGLQMDLSSYKHPPKHLVSSGARTGLDQSSSIQRTFSNMYSDKQRIEELESFRTPRNSHIIDAAIKDGRRAEYVALEIVKGGYHLSDDQAIQLEVDAMVAEAERLLKRQGRR